MRTPSVRQGPEKPNGESVFLVTTLYCFLFTSTLHQVSETTIEVPQGSLYKLSFDAFPTLPVKNKQILKSHFPEVGSGLGGVLFYTSFVGLETPEKREG